MDVIRYPIEPLVAAAGVSGKELRDRFALSGQRWKRWREVGLTLDEAERVALEFGFHPYELWPSMADEVLEMLYDKDDNAQERLRARKRATWHRLWARMTEEQREAKRQYARNYRSSVRAADMRRRARRCATRGCATVFSPARGDQRYCSATCRRREKMRRYRAVEPSRLAVTVENVNEEEVAA